MQIEGLAMGAPTSSILSEIYLQFLENNRIYNIQTTSKSISAMLMTFLLSTTYTNPI